MVTLFKLPDGTPARKFVSVEEMDAVMIANWNAVVKPDDHVWHLGDVTFNLARMGSIMPRLMGHKRLILGNHDKFKAQQYARWFEKIRGSQIHDRLLFTHFPIAPWSLGEKTQANVHGHVHQSMPRIYTAPHKNKDGTEKVCKYVNISVEQTGYRPVSLEEIKSWIK